MKKRIFWTLFFIAATSIIGIAGALSFIFWDDIELLLHKHNYVVTEEIAATCTEEGKAIYTCDCGEKKEETLPALGHTEKLIPGYESTCTIPGITDVTICDTCSTTIKGSQQQIPALGHNLVDGFCDRCDYVDFETLCPNGYMLVPATTTDSMTGRLVYLGKVSDPAYVMFSLGENGNSSFIAFEHGKLHDSRLGKLFIYEDAYFLQVTKEYDVSLASVENDVVCFAVSKHDHNYVATEEIVATCTKEGKAFYACDVCGARKEETLSALGHNLVDGFCDRCEYMDFETLFPNGYTLADVNETDSLTGRIVYLGQVSENPNPYFWLEKNENSFSASFQYDHLSDSRLGEVFVYEDAYFLQVTKEYDVSLSAGTVYFVVAKHKHNYVVTEEIAATCTEEGKQFFTCEDCDEKNEATLPALGHNLVDGFCDRCEYMDFETIFPNGYMLVNVMSTDDLQGRIICLGTVEENKTTSYAFNYKQGDVESIILWQSGSFVGDTLGEIFVHDDYIFIAVQEGYDSITTNGLVYFAVSKHDHNYVVTEEIAATCTEEGKAFYTCDVCGAKKEEPLPALGHNLVDGFCECCKYMDLDTLYPNGYEFIAVNTTDSLTGRLVYLGEGNIFTFWLGEESKISIAIQYGNLTDDRLGKIRVCNGKYFLQVTNEYPVTLSYGTAYLVEPINYLANWTMPASNGYTVDGNKLTFAGTHELVFSSNDKYESISLTFNVSETQDVRGAFQIGWAAQTMDTSINVIPFVQFNYDRAVICLPDGTNYDTSWVTGATWNLTIDAENNNVVLSVDGQVVYDVTLAGFDAGHLILRAESNCALTFELTKMNTTM